MEQYKTLCLKLRGHYQYYGIRSNYKMLEVVMEHVDKAWRLLAEPTGATRATSRGTYWRGSGSVFPLPKPRIYHAI